MQFMPQKAIKGKLWQIFWPDHPVPGTSKLYDNLPDKIAQVYLINTSLENKCGNYSLTEHQGQVSREASSQEWG